MDHFARLVHPLMIQRARHLAADVRHQTAAQRDIQQLMAAANGQQRLALAENFVQQNQLAQITPAAVRRHAHRFADVARQVAGVKIRINVVAAGEQHAVHAATISASSARSVVVGAVTGMPPAWVTDKSYLTERLTDKSRNSTPRFSMLGEIRIKGRQAIARNVKRFGEKVSGKSTPPGANRFHG